MELMGWGVAIAGGAVGLTVGATMDPIGKILAGISILKVTVGGFAIFPLLIGGALLLFGWHSVRKEGNMSHFFGGLSLGYGAFTLFRALGMENPFANIVGA